MEILISLLSLTFLEVVLGIDNLIILSILVDKAPKEKQLFTMRLGLTLAWVMRLILLAGAVWLAKLTTPIVHLGEFGLSVRDLFMLIGGLFLVAKAIHEIHEQFENHNISLKNRKPHGLPIILTQIIAFDMIFSIDSILTAIGLTQIYWIMATAISIAILTMIFASKPLHKFVNSHPTLKMLVLSFLVLIGAVLVADGLHFHVERGYLYFAICFSLVVETLNIQLAKHRQKK